MHNIDEQEIQKSQDHLNKFISEGNIYGLRINLQGSENYYQLLASSNCRGENILHFATKTGNVDIINLLTPIFLKQGLLDHADIYGRTALSYAVDQKSEQTVLALLSAGADVNAKSNRKHTYGGPKIIIGRGSRHFSEIGITALHVAANNSDVGMMKLLLNHGARVNEIVTSGSIPGIVMFPPVTQFTAMDIVIQDNSIDSALLLKEWEGLTSAQVSVALNNIARVSEPERLRPEAGCLMM